MDLQTGLPNGKFDTHHNTEEKHPEGLSSFRSQHFKGAQQKYCNRNISYVMHPCLIISSLINQGRFVLRISQLHPKNIYNYMRTATSDAEGMQFFHVQLPAHLRICTK